ncbi:hypothetical protein [Rhodoferax saidenbachensis]|uniref:Alkaline phytoceramidase n=1 Tax=Rhodoferax saidenbachensis TaxID=1484693 RepID=A0ABU1ZHN5_9BURK|nr:hypothetical protein [Rhodoferax saidenbachensis]MDR7304908.1 hypothetical protein [Rhodoferax saidenbachensis]
MPPLTRSETSLAAALLAALAVAVFGPFVAQYTHYHAFADQRAWLGVPHALDVLSNLPFALAGLLGLHCLWPQRGTLRGDVRAPLLALFFVGLVFTALCSGYYHWQPDNAGLAVDRAGMVLAFAGLLGAAVADRVSVRMGWVVALAVFLLGPMSVAVWWMSGNLLPWAVLQGGGMLLVLAMALRPKLTEGWGLPLVAVIAWYAFAKLLELGDHQVFIATHGWVSGHSLKHLAAAMAAGPVLGVMHNGAQKNIRGALPQAV